jgi:hypothetical protein
MAERDSVAAEVTKELQEMQKLGVPVTAKQLAYPGAHPEEMAEYRVNMKISEIADLVRELT